MNGITPSLQKKINYSVKVIQKAERLALSMNDEGFWLAFSGLGVATALLIFK